MYKFRGKSLNSDHYVYGDLTYSANGSAYINYFNVCDDRIAKSVTLKSIGQYLGFVDKNGKEVFSGDRVKLIYRKSYDEEAQVVIGVIQRDFIGTYVLMPVDDNFPQAGHAYYLKDVYDLDVSYDDKKVPHVAGVTVI